VLKHVEDVLNANGQDKFQTTRELPVLPDHSLNAQTALPEDLMTNTHAFNAQQDKSKIQPTWTDVSLLLVPQTTKSNFHITLNHVEDVILANGQTSSQTNSELLASQDQSHNATADKDIQQTNMSALNAQLDKSKAWPTTRFALDHHVPDNTKSLLQLINSAAEDVILANGQHSCQTHQELHALKDHLLNAAPVPPDNLTMVTHAKIAQLDRSKIQTTVEFASLQYVMDNMTLDFQSTLNHVEDANHANGQDKFQTMRELPVLTDHSLNAQIALLEDLLTTTHVSNAHQDKSKIQPAWTDVSLELVPHKIKSNSHMTLNHVEDVTLANGQTSSQINSRLLASQDQDHNATADKDIQQMDMNALNAQQELSKAWPTKKFVSDHHVPDNTKSLLLLINSAVEDVILANGHNSCQTHLELHALKDHLLNATVSAEEMLLDIHARDAQLDKFKIQTPKILATLQFVMDHTKSEDQLMPPHAVNAKIANGQDTFQTTLELNVFWDHSLNVIASANNQPTVMNVNSAHSDKDKIQLTLRDVSKHQDATLEIKLLVLEMLLTATDAEHALFHSSQDKTDLNATDQDQLADVLRNTQLMDTAAFHAQLDKFQMSSDNNATQLNNASDQEKFLVLLKTATHANNAHQTLFQTLTDWDVLDQSQFAHVLKDTLPTVMSAKSAQPDKLLIQTTTRDVSQESATKEIKSLEPETTAGNARPAQQATSQTHKEANVSESSQLAHVPKSMTQVVMYASHAHHIKLLPMVTKDVFQDNAQDSTKSLVQPINAMLANNAKRDPPQITSEEDAWDTSSLNALATRDSMTLDSDVLTAQLVPGHPLITEAVSASTVTRTKSWEEIYSAHNVNGAHQAQSQIQRERTVSSSQDHQLPLTVDQLVMNSQFSTWTEQSASNVQTTWRHQQITWDVWTHALTHLISFKRMDHASHAAMVTFQTTQEPDVSRRSKELPNAQEKEKSSALTDQDVLHVTHTPEPKDQTPSASQINAQPTKSSLG
jgi:uncharacterized protein (UPF0216 family)